MIEFNTNANGGTENFARLLQNNIPQELLNKFQIICDNVRFIDKSKYNILYLNNTPEQIDNKKNLSNGNWKQFHKIVFVSYWQMEEYVREYQIPYSQCVVIPLAIIPIEKKKIKFKIKLH